MLPQPMTLYAELEVHCEFIYDIDGRHPRSSAGAVNTASPSMTLLNTCNAGWPNLCKFKVEGQNWVT